MHAMIGRRTAVLIAAMSSGLLAGCGDKRVDSLSTGIPRDSALKILAGGPSSDSLAK